MSWLKRLTDGKGLFIVVSGTMWQIVASNKQQELSSLWRNHMREGGIPMTFEQLMAIDVDNFSGLDITAWLETAKFTALKKKQFDQILDKFGNKPLQYNQFPQYYAMKCDENSSAIMIGWTRVVGWLTVALSIMTLLTTIKLYQI